MKFKNFAALILLVYLSIISLHASALPGFVAVGWNGDPGLPPTAWTSSDGTTWSNGIRLPNPNYDRPYAVAGNSSQWVTVGQAGMIFTSTNGSDWIQRASTPEISLLDIDWNGHEWTTVGSTINNNGIMFTSSDAITWTRIIIDESQIFLGIAHNANMSVVVGTGGVIWTKTLTGRWTLQNSGVTTALRGVAWDGKQWMAVGDYGVILTSPDAIQWTRQNGVNGDLRTVAGNGQLWVAKGALWGVSSTDGITWRRFSHGGQSLIKIIWSGNQWIAVGARGLATSDSHDGLNWTNRIDPGRNGYIWGIGKEISG